LGNGISEFIIVLSSALMQNPAYIFIDEPEASLHPKMQEVFVRALATKARKGLFAVSHSIALARSAGDYLYSLTRRAGNRPNLQPYGLHYQPTLAQTVNEMGYSQFVEIGGDNILLVEGRTDVKVFREILRKYGIENQFIILPFGGRQFMTTDGARIVDELAEIKRLNARSVSVIFDSERKVASEALKPEFENLVKTCESLGYHVFPTDRHSTENYITQEAIDKVMGEGYQALEPFEDFNKVSKRWHKEKNWLMVIEMTRDDFAGTRLDLFIKDELIPLFSHKE